MQKRRRSITILVSLATFIAGVLAQLAFDKLDVGLLQTDQRLIIALLAGLSLISVCLILILAIVFQEVYAGHKNLSDQVQALSKKFGLLAEYVEDGLGEEAGMTYVRTAQLVKLAENSLVFVDFWIQSGEYIQRDSLGYQRRKAYYEAIIEQIEGHQRYQGEYPFHRRLVQNPVNLYADSMYSTHLRRCLDIQKEAPNASLIKATPPYIHTHFAIIDDKYVVWPILTSHPKGGGLRRHGAIFFTDPKGDKGDFIQLMKVIYNTIDRQGRPFDENLISQPQDQHLQPVEAPSEPPRKDSK